MQVPPRTAASRSVAVIILAAWALDPSYAQTTNEIDYVVEVSASAQVSPAQITLNWAQEYYAPSSILPGTVTGHDVFRRDGDFRQPTLHRSTDSGSAWASVSNAPSASFFSIEHGGGTWIAVGEYGVIYTSPDGNNWTHRPVTFPQNAEFDHFTDIAYDGAGRWVAANHGFRAYTSTDSGATWSQLTAPSGYSWGNLRALAYGNGTWAMTGGWKNQLNTSYVFTSTNGTTWTQRTLPSVNTYLYDIAHQGGSSSNWVTVGVGGHLFTSTDNAGSWALRTTGTTARLWSVVYGAGTWVVVGESASEAAGSAVILTSTNLTTWTARTSGTSRSLRKVVHDGSKFIALGDRGVRLHSTDGSTWTAQPDLGTRTVSGLARNGSTWIASHALMWGTPLVAQLPVSPRTWTDTNVEAGKRYEYRIVRRQGTSEGSWAYGYHTAGIALPLQDDRGRVLLALDNAVASALPVEVERFKQDLTGDGWEVVTLAVDPATATPQTVKASLVAAYQAAPATTRSIILLGDIPYAYAGTDAPDGHSDHTGAWVADPYYADLDGTWTDTAVNVTGGARALANTPGDGRFDQNRSATPADVGLGRITFGNLPVFSETALELVKRYLDKNHAFRQKMRAYQERAYVSSTWGSDSTVNGDLWRANSTFSSLFGSQVSGGYTYSYANNAFLPALSAGSYLWAYGSGPGNDDSAQDVAVSANFTTGNYQAVFTFFFGSYFGNYYKSNNLLRAALAHKDHILTSAWGSRPGLRYHGMGAGGTVGESWRNSMGYLGNGRFYAGVEQTYEAPDDIYRHAGLLGDPTLRLHVLAPPTSGSINASNQLSWIASADSVDGYHIYRSATKHGTYTRLTPDLVTGTTWTDPSPLGGTSYYQVRATKLRTGLAGSYWNNSQGLFLARSTTAPAAPSSFSVTSATGSSLALSWTDHASNENHFLLERRIPPAAFAPLATIPLDTTAYTDSSVASGTAYEYRLSAVNNAGASSTVIVAVTTPPATPANFAATTTASSINLAWTDAATNETGYELQRKTGAAGTWTTLATKAPNATSHSDDTIALEQTYVYRVRALGTANSPWSAEAKATAPWTFLETGAPVIPGDLDASGTAWTLKSAGRLIWGNTDAMTFAHQPAPSSGELVVRLSSWSNTQAWTRAGLMLRDGTAANARNFSLLATPSNGLFVSRRDSTNGSTARHDTVTPTPSLSNLWMRLAWGGGTVTAYYSTNGGSTWTQIDQPVNISGWSNLRIGLVGSSDNASRLSVFNFANVSLTETAPPGSPAAPTTLAVGSPTSSTLSLTWTDNSANETGFKIERSLNAGGPFTVVHTAAANATAHTDTGLDPGTVYYYRVRATNASGDSSPSNTAFASTEANAALFAYDGFASSDYPNVDVLIAGLAPARTGWSATGWESPGNAVRLRATGLGYTSGSRTLADTPARRIEAANNGRTGRYLDTSANGPFAALRDTATGRLGKDGTTLYLSFLMRINANGYNAFELHNGGTGDSARVFQIGRVDGVSSTDYKVRRIDNATLRQEASLGALDTAINLFVVKIEFGAGTTAGNERITVWRNPDLASEAANSASAVVIANANHFLFDRMSVASFAGGGSGGNTDFDEFRFGNTWSSVTPHTGGATPPAAPGAPGAAALSSSAIQLLWTDSSADETGFKIERSPDGHTTWTLVHTTSANVTTWTDTGLAPGATRYYRIRATNAAGDSAATSVVNATTWTALEQWRSDNSLPGDLTTDTDGDGVANLLEYALGTSPTSGASASPPQPEIVAGHLTLSFLRARPDITYEVLASSTLASNSWQVIATNPGQVGHQVVVTDPVPVTANPRRFLRLRVSTP